MLSEKDRKEISNGCGSKSAFWDFVPDSMWFLDISKACDIHDYMYKIGKNRLDKDRADSLEILML